MKSSAEGVIVNCLPNHLKNPLSFFLPSNRALTGEYFASAFSPVVSSTILLNSVSKVISLSAIACCTLDLTST